MGLHTQQTYQCPIKDMGSNLEPTPTFHDLLGCIPSCLQNFLVPDPAQFPSPLSTKSSEFPLSQPPPAFPEMHVLVAHGLTILNQHFQKTAAAISTHRSRSQRYLNDKPGQNLHFTDLPNSTGKKLHKACSSWSAFPLQWIKT